MAPCWTDLGSWWEPQTWTQSLRHRMHWRAKHIRKQTESRIGQANALWQSCRLTYNTQLPVWSSRLHPRIIHRHNRHYIFNYSDNTRLLPVSLHCTVYRLCVLSHNQPSNISKLHVLLHSATTGDACLGELGMWQGGLFCPTLQIY